MKITVDGQVIEIATEGKPGHRTVHWTAPGHPTITPSGHALYEAHDLPHHPVRRAAGVLLVREKGEEEEPVAFDREGASVDVGVHVPGDHHPRAHHALRARLHHERVEDHHVVHHAGLPHAHVHREHYDEVAATLAELPHDCPEPMLVAAVVIDYRRVARGHAAPSPA